MRDRARDCCSGKWLLLDQAGVRLVSVDINTGPGFALGLLGKRDKCQTHKGGMGVRVNVSPCSV